MPSCSSTAGSVTISTSAEYTTASGVTISSFMVAATSGARRGDFFDPALHVEVVLGHLVVLAVEDFLEAAHRIGDRHLLAFASRERLRGTERLAQEPLDLPRAQHRLLVLGRELVHPENRDDVLQILEPLQHLLHAAGDVVVLLADSSR